MARWLGRRLGDLAWAVLARRRRVAVDNVARAFPHLSPWARRNLARRSFQHLGLVGAELCRALEDPLERTLSRIAVDGLGHLEKAMAAHGRVLVLSAHLGNWELLALAHRLTGFPLTVVVRPLDAPWLDVLMRRVREAAGAEIIAKRDAIRPVLEALRHGRMVAILLDQNATRREAVFVPFFGHPASTSRSIATLAVRTRAAIVPIFIRREARDGHRISIEEPLVAPPGQTPGDAIVQLTRACTERVERAIRVAPDQWLWMHARWRTRPPGEVR